MTTHGREISAVDLLLIAYNALPPDTQEEAFERLAQTRLECKAAEGTEAARFLRSLIRARDLTGRTPTPEQYKAAYLRLRESGEEIESLTRVIRHYGSWRRAKEAIALSESSTAERIEARFRARRLGKIYRYSEETLIDTLRRCGDEFGRAPMVGEFERWRKRELELAAVQGNDWLHLPHSSVYQKRWGPRWEQALAHVFDSDQVAARLEQP